MRFFILLLSLFTNSLLAQQSVKIIDQTVKKEVKGKLTKLKKDKYDNQLLVYIYKTDKRIFSVSKRMAFKSGGVIDSTVAYQFAFISDTLLRVWFTKIDPIRKKKGHIIAYINGDKLLAQESHGDIYMPDLAELKSKSKELMLLGIELVNSKTKY